MVLKIVGSAAILIACTGLGFEKTQQMKLHIRQLEELKRIIVLFRSELYYTKVPFAELFRKVSIQTEGPFQNWLLDLANNLEKHQSESFLEAWIHSIEMNLKNSFLKKFEIDSLLQLGTSLNQIESLDLYLEQLDLFIQRAREEEHSQKKLYQSMGVLGGIFLVIILL